MKKWIFLFSVIFINASHAQNDDLKHTIETFFEGFHHRDTILLHQVCADKMILQTITENTNGTSLTEEPSQYFYRSIASMPKDLKYNEKILSFTTQVDGSLGHVWTPYEFYLDGKLSHTGVNSFTLFKEKDQWKIVYIIDTRRK